MTLPEPWHPVKDGPTAQALADELARELSNDHPLFGVKAVALARRADNDDVLFRLLDGSGRLAVVHLTWRGNGEPPSWPRATLYAGADEWEAQARHNET